MVRLLRALMIAGMLLVSTQAQSDSFSQTLKTMLGQNTFPLLEDEVNLQLSQRPLLEAFYQQRDYKPGWVTHRQADILVSQLLQAIDKAQADGLDPSYPGYHKLLIERSFEPTTLEKQVLLDLILSDAFMTLAFHLHHGVAFKTEVDTLHRAIKPAYLNLPKKLAKALQNTEITETLVKLSPQHQHYLNLKKALHHYQKIAEQGGWDEDPEVYLDPEKVKARLSITGEFHDTAPPSANTLAEDTIAWNWKEAMPSDPTEKDPFTEAVKEFQRRQHIMIDGIVGPQTRMKLAQSVQQIIERIRLNLERWRWFNPLVDDNYIIVNIPDFSMQYVHNGQSLIMHAVVGHKDRQTPMMQANMSYLVFNPYWRIPKTILTEDILPKLRANKEYLKSNQISLFSSADQAENRPLDATIIDWNDVTKRGMLRYTFRQEAGGKNPLGVIKFMFPNSEDIYIHDTSARYLFKNKTFLVSSGCIRAEKPMQLAYEILLREQPDITYESIYQQIQAGKQKVVWLKEKIPVYLTYQTAWADENGRLYLRQDAYDLDANLLNFMKINLKMNPD